MGTRFSRMDGADIEAMLAHLDLTREQLAKLESFSTSRLCELTERSRSKTLARVHRWRKAARALRSSSVTPIQNETCNAPVTLQNVTERYTPVTPPKTPAKSLKVSKNSVSGGKGERGDYRGESGKGGMPGHG
jgi:hypothetical protein